MVMIPMSYGWKQKNIIILENILLGGKYHYVHDEFAGENLSELWTAHSSSGNGSNAASSIDTVGAWNAITADPPAANETYTIYGKQEFIFDTNETVLTIRAAPGSLSNIRVCVGVNNPHGDVSYDWFNPGTSLAAGIFFEYNSATSPNWLARVINGATDWSDNTGIEATTDLTDFRIERKSATSHVFSINGVVVSEYTSAISNNTDLSCCFHVKALTTTKKWVTIDSMNFLHKK